MNNVDSNDTNISLSSARIQYPDDWRDSLEKSVVESPTGRREVLRNNRSLSPNEKTEERLEELLALPRSVADAGRQVLVLYVGGATVIRTSESLAPLGQTGLIIGSMPWIAVLTFVIAASRQPSNLLGLAWRLTFVALGGL